MKKLIEEISTYDITLKEFDKYVIEELKLSDYKKFYETASNAVIIPQLINFLEKRYNIEFLDAICYVQARTNERGLSFNDLVKKTIRTLFFMTNFGHPLDFLPF